MATAKQLAAELEQKRTALRDEFDKHKTADGYDIPSDKVGEFRKRNDELNELGSKWESALEVERLAADNDAAMAKLKTAQRPAFLHGSKGGRDGDSLIGGAGDDLVAKSLGQLFAEKAYERSRDGGLVIEDGRPRWRKERDIELAGFNPIIGLKTTMTTSAGFAPENPRSGKLQLSAQRPLMVADLLPTIPLSTGSAYVYMEETTFTNNAAEIAENDGTGAAEGALAYTERSVSVRRIATVLPVTDEQLADVAGMQSLVDGRVRYMVEQRLDGQLLSGDGNAPNISGFYTQVTQAQAKSTDPVFDAIFKGMIKVMHTGYANATGIVLHPNDWQDIRLTRTVDGIYILGNPGDDVTQRLFGVPVVVTTAATENTGLVGDFRTHAALVYREGAEVRIFDQHSDYPKKFLQLLRASIRAALVVFRPAAFCEVTGI
jgi:HK97 family phage major capsid protein